MSDGSLLGFGCAVTFIALGGVYAYLLEAFSAQERKSEAERQREREAEKVQDVA